MNTLTIIELEWNCYNGLIFSVFRFDLNKPNIDSALLGINISKSFLYVDILFSTLKIFDRNENKDT